MRDNFLLTLRAKEKKQAIVAVRAPNSVLVAFLAAASKLERDAAVAVLKEVAADMTYFKM